MTARQETAAEERIDHLLGLLPELQRQKLRDAFVSRAWTVARWRVTSDMDAAQCAGWAASAAARMAELEIAPRVGANKAMIEEAMRRAYDDERKRQLEIVQAAVAVHEAS